jgi:endonuclease-3
MIGLELKTKKIYTYLKELFPSAKCELEYKKDYELLIAVCLSAQTTDKKVNEVTRILFSKYPSLEALNKADINDIGNILRPIGTFNKKALYIKNIVSCLKEKGFVPNDRILLESIKGVGHKTVNVVLSNLYKENVLAVDTHVSRVCKRLGLVRTDNVLEIEKKVSKIFKNYSLSFLHHALVLFGRYECMAKKPKCLNCKLKDICMYYKG